MHTTTRNGAQTTRILWASLVMAAAILTTLCARNAAFAAQTRADAIKAGSYRALLTVPGGDLPFGLDLKREGAVWVGYLINGTEHVRLNEVDIRGSHLDIKMPGYENRLSATAQGNELRGEVVLNKLGGKDQHIPLRAIYAQNYRFFPPQVHETATIAGRWAVTFSEDGAKPEAAVGEFSQLHDVVTGTFLTETGDHRYLAGQVHDGELFLSTFDGAHVFLYKAKIAAKDGSLDGDFWSGIAYHERWTAKRDPQAALPDAFSITAMRSANQHLDFAFPDLAGNPVTSRDPRFQHKVLIVALAGSWCPNCHDEAAFLAPMYRRYRAQGLEVISLMFEHFGDFDRAAAATQRFRQHYAIEYTTLIAGISDKDEAAKKLPMLDRVYAFPTMIFIDRSGRVRKIHTGFSGPATGNHYVQFEAEFTRTLDQLLAES